MTHPYAVEGFSTYMGRPIPPYNPSRWRCEQIQQLFIQQIVSSQTSDTSVSVDPPKGIISLAFVISALAKLRHPVRLFALEGRMIGSCMVFPALLVQISVLKTSGPRYLIVAFGRMDLGHLMVTLNSYRRYRSIAVRYHSAARRRCCGNWRNRKFERREGAYHGRNSPKVSNDQYGGRACLAEAERSARISFVFQPNRLNRSMMLMACTLNQPSRRYREDEVQPSLFTRSFNVETGAVGDTICRRITWQF